MSFFFLPRAAEGIRCFAICIAAQTIKSPPKTRTDSTKEVLHGVEVADPYRWLEDKDSTETRTWIKEQNEYTHSMLGSLPNRDLLRSHLSSLLKVDSPISPRVREGKYFYSRLIAGNNLAIIYMKKSADSPEEILIDPHPLSADHKKSVSISDISKDGNLLAYFIRSGGEDEVEYHFLNTETRKELTDVLPRSRTFGVSIRPDKAGFYYTRYEAQGPRAYYHAFGSDITKDVELFGKGYGPEKMMFTNLSQDGHYLSITALEGTSGKYEVYFKDLIKDGPITTIVNDIDADFYGSIIDNKMIMYTNWKAPNGRFMLVDLTKPTKENWQELIPEEKSAVFDSYSLVGKKLFINYLENVVSRVKVFDINGKYLRDIKFPTLGTVSRISGTWDSSVAFFSFRSFHIPTTVYQYDTGNGEYKAYSRLNVPIKEDDYVVKQEWYESKDHTRIPMFLVYPKGIKLDGSNPTLLYGYGGFQTSLTPEFNATAAAWVSTGGIYAVANIRGGSEFGEDWHKAGMLDKKQNVFDDFIAAAEYLAKSGYARSDKLAIYGGSNGGLLVGACMTQHPELFRAVLCEVPLLDMVRYHKFLVARFWIPEYGSSDDVNQFKYIHAYSPYHNVKPGTKYPAAMFVTGDSDTRVDPLHARKMTALLQAKTGATDRPILLDYDIQAGHSGSKPVSQLIEDSVNKLSFLLWQLDAKAK